jgi:hypothetical protein
MVDQVLFKFKEYVQLWYTNGNAPNINGPMIQYDTKVYKGGTNTIDFVVRNNDRKPVNLAGYQIDALIQRVESVTTIPGNGYSPLAELLLIQPVQTLQDTAGTCRLVLTDLEIGHWLGGYYRYTIRLTDVTGVQTFLYTDINRSTYGTFELIEGMSTSLVPAINVPAYQFTPETIDDLTNQYIFASGALAGDAQAERSNGMHTMVAYTGNGYAGKLWIQVSLTLSAPTAVDWSNIPIGNGTDYFQYIPPYNSPRIKVFNFTGNYYWVRAIFENPMYNTCPSCNQYYQRTPPAPPCGPLTCGPPPYTCISRNSRAFQPWQGPWPCGPNPQPGWPPPPCVPPPPYPPAPYPPPPGPYPPAPPPIPYPCTPTPAPPYPPCNHGYFAGILYKN